MRERLKRFLRELFFGTDNRAILSIVFGATLAICALYASAIALVYYVFDLKLLVAMAYVADTSILLMGAYGFYRIGRAAIDAWRESEEV